MKQRTIKIIYLLISSVIMLALVGGCDKNRIKNSDVPLGYSTGINQEGFYDSSIFYRNDLNFTDAADPGVVYEDGYFYLYATVAPIRVWRTRNFADFEYLGHAFTPSADSWAYGNFWAPEVIKNPVDNKYYMYYSASSKIAPPTVSSPVVNERMLIGLAVSDKPEGPFTEWTGTRTAQVFNASGQLSGTEQQTVSVSDKLFDFTQGPVAAKYLQGKAKLFPVIDASPFFDDDGQLYLYFVKHSDRNISGNSVWGVKMIDMATPDYTTLTQLTEPGKYIVGGSDDKKIDIEYDGSTGQSNKINEAPYMTTHTTVRPDGTSAKTYYLGFSIYGYENRRYSVCTAIADGPLGYAVGSEAAPDGGFVKLDSSFSQAMHKIELDFDHMSGTGHHQFVQAGDELFIIYHAHKDREYGSTQRAIAADRAFYVYNEQLGLDIIHSNGPTYSLQPAPSAYSGYKNIAAQASFDVTNVKSGKAGLLKDNLVVIHNYDDELELKTNGETVITISFDGLKVVRAVMIYNSSDLNLAFSKIDSIIFDTGKGRYYIENLAFPTQYYSEDSGIIRPGGAAVASFNEITVKSISIKISSKISTFSDSDIGLSEIIVLGK